MKEGDRSLSPQQVPDFIARTTGVEVSQSTVDRWLKKGCAGVIFEHKYISLHIYVTERAVEAFLARVDAAHRTPENE